VVISVSGAKAFYTDGSSEQLKVTANGQLLIPIHFSVQASGSTDLTFDIMPNTVHISNGGVLNPVIHVAAVGKSQNGSTTTTQTAEVDEAEGATTSSSSTTISTSTKTSRKGP